jgi:hypothetical protein
MIPHRIKRIFWLIELIPKLGAGNVFYVIYYRMLLKSGFLAFKFPVIKIETPSPLFNACPQRSGYPVDWKHKLVDQAERITRGEMPYYSYHLVSQSSPPDWFINPFNGKRCKQAGSHWTRINDFNEDLGDIKNLWEPSRFTWLGILARAYVIGGDKKYLDTLNEWLIDWVINNPVNQGPNWKCGQEASFRVMNLLNAAIILDQTDKPSEKLIEIISYHLKRISGNTRYAVSQRNNHATSEAAALFIGGNWLINADQKNAREYKAYSKKGREMLERMLKSLVYPDGSFAQHSVNYHRLLLDTVSFVIYWVNKLNLEPLSVGFTEITQKSVYWLLSIIDDSGMCPNLGANDGTLLVGNHSCDYRDYRPSLQLASSTIKDNLSFDRGPWDETLYWFDLKRNNFSLVPVEKRSKTFSSGYVVMNGENSWALLRYPFFRYRPSHNDVFHFDLWANGKNLLMDSGTFSYNTGNDDEGTDYKSVHSHNTLSFDNHEQMPKLGRFLMGKWIKPLITGDIQLFSNESGEWAGAYQHYSGNIHRRKVNWNENKWVIEDEFNGTAKHVKAGFNFNKCDYKLDQKMNTISLPWGNIKVSPNAEISVEKHFISRYYMQNEEVNRLVIKLENNSEIITTINIS